jgi:hypothetical protein
MMASGPAKQMMVEPAQIRNACNVLSIDMLREMMSQSRQYEAAKLWFARKDQLISHIEKEVLAAGALELILKLSYGNVHAWLTELDEVVGDQNLYDMRQALHRTIEGTPLAFIGILGEALLRNIAAELRLDATAPKDEVRGTIKDELQLEGLESFLDRLSLEHLQRLWAEWGLEPASPTSADKCELIEHLVMWVFDIDMGGAEMSQAEVDATEASVEEQGESRMEEDSRMEEEDETLGEHDESVRHEAESEGERPDDSVDGVASVSVSAIAAEEGDEDEHHHMPDLSLDLSADGSVSAQLEQSVDRSAGASVHEAEAEDQQQDGEAAEEAIAERDQVMEITTQTVTEVTELSVVEISTDKKVHEDASIEEEQNEDEDVAAGGNAFQQEPIEEEEVILSRDEGDEDEEQANEESLVQPTSEEKEEEAAPAEQMRSEAREDEEVKMEEADAPAKEDEAAEQQEQENQPSAEQKEEEEVERKVPSTPRRSTLPVLLHTVRALVVSNQAFISTSTASRLVSNIEELKPGLTHADLEGFSNTVLRRTLAMASGSLSFYP